MVNFSRLFVEILFFCENLIVCQDKELEFVCKEKHASPRQVGMICRSVELLVVLLNAEQLTIQ
jgi:hypothetical protein